MWNTQVYEFGKGFEEDVIEFEFEYSGDKTYQKHSSSCGCTTAKQETDKLLVKYVAGKVPEHVKKEKGYTDVNKKVFVTFTDGTLDTLVIKGKIYPKL